MFSEDDIQGHGFNFSRKSSRIKERQGNPRVTSFTVTWTPHIEDLRSPHFTMVPRAVIEDYGVWNINNFVFEQYVYDEARVRSPEGNLDYARDWTLDNFSLGGDGDQSAEGILSYFDQPGWTGGQGHQDNRLPAGNSIDHYTVGFCWVIRTSQSLGNRTLLDTRTIPSPLYANIADYRNYWIAPPQPNDGPLVIRIQWDTRRHSFPDAERVAQWAGNAWDIGGVGMPPQAWRAYAAARR